MPTNYKRHSLVAIALSAAGLAGCGTDETLSDFGVETSTPLVCKSPETINDAGTACELVLTACNFPEVADEQGLCVQFTGQWPDAGDPRTDIVMPEPVYMAQARAGGGFDEVVYYYNREDAAFDGWGLHAWNNATCASYEQFSADGGTDWGIPIVPTGVDPNFGIYWNLALVDVPNCTNFIPYGFEIDAGNTLQTNDLSVDLSSTDTNPTGNFYILGLSATDARNTTVPFPYPRTFESLVVPGGSTPPPLVCELPEVINEDGTECLAPTIEEFIPGEVTLYLRGGFNGWGTVDDEFALDDTVAFHYADNIYTATLTLPVPAEGDSYAFKIADEAWSEATSFGSATGEETLELDTAKTLFTGKDANGDDIEQNINVTVTEEISLQFTIDASDATAPVLSVTEVPLASQLYLRGSMNDWGNDADGNFSLASGAAALPYQGDNVYTARVMLTASETAYNFKIADAAWADNNFGAAAGEELVTLDDEKILATGEDSQNLQFTVTEDGAYDISVDVSDVTMPVLTVSSSVPFELGTKLYLRGSFNGWGNDGDAFALDDTVAFHYADYIYTATMMLPGSTDAYAFKVADQDWAVETSFGAAVDDETVEVNVAKALVTGKNPDGSDIGQNMSITVAEDSNLQFIVDVTDPENPMMMVNTTPIAANLYVRGSMNDWGNVGDAFGLDSGAKALRYQGQNLYTTEIMMPAGSNNFKVADATWDVANFGSMTDDANVVLGEAKTLAVGNDSGNISYEAAEAATFLLSVDVTDLAAPVFRLTEQAPYGSEGLFLRGAMFGWDDPSTNPMTYEGSGIYSIDVDLTLDSAEPFTYNFKVSGRDWTSPVDFGAPPEADNDQAVTLDTPKALVLKDGDGSNSNLQLTITESDTFIFSVDASDTEAATLTVTTSDD